MSDEDAHLNRDQQLVTVELVGLPIELAQRSNEHHATLTRELAFVEAAGESATTPGKLIALSARLAQKYASIGAAQQQRAVAVAATGGRTIDLRYEVPSEIAEAEALFRLYQEVDQYCLTGELVSLMMPVDIVEFRRWVSDQFCSQIRSGATPTPWHALPPTATDSPPSTPRRLGRIAVDEDLDLGGAARLRNVVAQQLELQFTDLEVDLEHCLFIDSTGISMLLTTLSRLRDAGGSLVLINVPDPIKRTLQYGGVYDMLTAS